MPTSHCGILTGMVANVFIKFGWASMKIVGDIAF